MKKPYTPMKRKAKCPTCGQTHFRFEYENCGRYLEVDAKQS